MNKKYYSEKITYYYGMYNGARMLIGAINTLFLINEGVSLGDVAFLQMLYTISVFLFEIPTGVIADVISRKLSVILSCLLLFVYYPLVYLGTPNIAILCIAQIIYALSLCLVSGAFEGWQVYIVKQEHPDNPKKINYYGHMKYEINSLVTMFSGTLGSILVYLGGKNYSCLYFICGFIMCILAILFCKVPYKKACELKEKGAMKKAILNYKSELIQGMSICFRNVHGWAYLLGLGLLVCSYQIVYFYWQPYFTFLANNGGKATYWNNKEELLLGIVFFVYSFARFILNRYVRKKVIEKYNAFKVSIVCLIIAIMSMILFSSKNHFNIVFDIVLFAILQGTTTLVESIIESQFLKKCVEEFISCSLSIISAITSLMSVGFLCVISKTLNSDNMRLFFCSTTIMYFLVIIVNIFWSYSYNREDKK